MSFFKTVKSSIFDPVFYENLKKQELANALKYFFILILLVTFINLLLLSFSLLIEIPRELKASLSQTVNSYPPDLVVEIKDGIVSTNAEEPLFVPFPANARDRQDFNNLLVIDTKTPYSAAQFSQYKTALWLTKDSLFYENNGLNQRSVDLSEIESFVINKVLVMDIGAKISPWLNSVGPFLWILLFVLFYLGLIFKLLYFFFLAALIFVLSSIFKWGLTYKASYITSIYASTLALFVDILILSTEKYTGFNGFPFLFTLVSLCIATINFRARNN